MKQIGLIFIAIGIALLIFFVINVLRENNNIVSPIPEEKGVKVIFVSPEVK